MIGWFYLLAATALGTALWPMARWTLAEEGNPRVMGFWVSLTSGTLSLAILHFRGANFHVPSVWTASVVFAVAYAVGFNILIMRCLQTGPTGPTVTVNNSAMICGILADIMWLRPRTPNSWVLAGLAGVFAALVLIGFGGQNAPLQKSRPENTWLRMVLAGGLLSGFSFISQTYVGERHPGIDNSLLFSGCGFGLAACILLLSLSRDPLLVVRHKRELAGGIILGFSNMVGFSLTILAFKDMGAEIVLPVSITTPMVLVLGIGCLAYGERPNREVWMGCLLAVLALGALSYGSSL